MVEGVLDIYGLEVSGEIIAEGEFTVVVNDLENNRRLVHKETLGQTTERQAGGFDLKATQKMKISPLKIVRKARNL